MKITCEVCEIFLDEVQFIYPQRCHGNSGLTQRMELQHTEFHVKCGGQLGEEELLRLTDQVNWISLGETATQNSRPKEVVNCERKYYTEFKAKCSGQLWEKQNSKADVMVSYEKNSHTEFQANCKCEVYNV